MDEDETQIIPVNPEPTPPDKAAVRSLRLAFFAFVVAGLTLWLANFFGAIACNLGLVLWVLCLIPSVVMALSALRGAVFSDTPQLVRRQAVVSLVISGVNITLGLAFIWAVLQG